MSILRQGFAKNLTSDQRLGLCNFFLLRAKLAQNVHQLYNSLYALKHYLKNVPLVASLDGRTSVAAGESGDKSNLKLRVVDYLGNSVSGIKDVKVTLTNLDDKSASATKDITSLVELNKDKNVV